MLIGMIESIGNTDIESSLDIDYLGIFRLEAIQVGYSKY